MAARSSRSVHGLFVRNMSVTVENFQVCAGCLVVVLFDLLLLASVGAATPVTLESRAACARFAPLGAPASCWGACAEQW